MPLAVAPRIDDSDEDDDDCMARAQMDCELMGLAPGDYGGSTTASDAMTADIGTVGGALAATAPLPLWCWRSTGHDLIGQPVALVDSANERSDVWATGVITGFESVEGRSYFNANASTCDHASLPVLSECEARAAVRRANKTVRRASPVASASSTPSVVAAADSCHAASALPRSLLACSQPVPPVLHVPALAPSRALPRAALLPAPCSRLRTHIAHRTDQPLTNTPALPCPRAPATRLWQ